MGRYYNGDIEGKFWSGIQSSDDADNFGVCGKPPSELYYYFDEEDLIGVENGIKYCLDGLGKYKEELDKFFEENNVYNDEMLNKAGFPQDEINHLLKLYARLGLGIEIRDCIKEKGSCEFRAEC